ncbi:SRPBCC family protein [Pseudoruegeria sp. HB172150]|uniref:SRPBCC family protein n=1 Tax=Pseudoruegeria sp. HB172150 TaxID=2721164 RepID=UPI001557DD9B|nr:SRPBCC family protein [Pseudoruegeria sp. HB172150]
MRGDETEVDLPDERTVRVKRAFAAPPDLVYKAFTEPGLLRRWLLGPPGWEMSVCEMDLRVGGKYRWRWRNQENGQEFGFYGEVTELDPPGNISHTEYFDPGDVGGDMGKGSAVTTSFAAEGAGTRMTVTIVYDSAEDREAAMSTGMTDGMEMSYQRLDGMLAEGI